MLLKSSRIASHISRLPSLTARLLCLVGFSVILSPLWASPDQAVIEQRELYRQAITALAEGKRRTFKKINKKLADYPLYPYLEYAELATRIRLSSQRDIDDFLAKYEGIPIARQLRHRWLEYLRNRDRWRDYLDYYQPSNSTVDQRCYYQLARYRSGDREAALEEAVKLWSVGKSQPKACDKLFGILIENNRITEPLAWQRFSKAVLNHQYQLARYLKRFFQSAYYRSMADTFYKIDRNPKLLGSIVIAPEQLPELLPVIEHGIVHRARRDPRSALAYWGRYQQMYRFSARAENTIISALVKGLFTDEQYSVADDYLENNRYKVDAHLIEWRIRQAISKANWQDTLDWIALLPAEYQQEKRWQYWAVRAKELNEPTGKTIYQDHYKQLSGERNYYSFLASQHLGLAFDLEHMPSEARREEIEAIEHLPAFQRIRELLHHDELLHARREWFQSTRNFNEVEWITAAHVATGMGWYSKAIESMIKASYWDDIDIRFPLVHRQVFSEQARQTDIPLPWLFALARQESSLASDATSPAGARGLMQLMPATAREVAIKHNIPYRHHRDLYQPEFNIRLGSRYFRQMLDRYDNNRVLATAAYNAGPHRVDRWLKKTGAVLPVDAWIEQIPFKETRNYVQNVMAFAAIYSHHLKLEYAMFNGPETNNLL